MGPEHALGLWISDAQNYFLHTISTYPLGFISIWPLQGATHPLRLNPQTPLGRGLRQFDLAHYNRGVELLDIRRTWPHFLTLL